MKKELALELQQSLKSTITQNKKRCKKFFKTKQKQKEFFRTCNNNVL